jgi:hypothetical protein
LLSNTTSEVGLLDTTGTFDVLRLHAAILSRIKSNAKESNSDERVEAILQRVKIIRVFDFIGVVESVNEIASTLESRPAATPPPKYNTVAAHKAREIPDSEDENSDEGKDTPPERTPEGQSDSAETRKMEMLIIDNITSAISPVFKSNHIQGKL